MSDIYLLEKSFELISEVYRARKYYHKEEKTWYEKCPVIKQTEKRLTVKSQNFPDTPLSPGGTFQLNLEKLKKEGRVYHSKNHDYFYLIQPKQGDLFPSKEVIESSDWLILEAISLGWEVPNNYSEGWEALHKLEEWKRDCLVLASLSKLPLKKIIEIYEKGEFEQLAKKYYTWAGETWDGLLDKSTFEID
jgi:hypothetical protein